MQYRFNFLVDSLYDITIWRTVANINKCNFRCAHTKAQQTVPEQTSPTVTNPHKIFKCQWSNYITHSRIKYLLPQFIWHMQLLHHLMALSVSTATNSRHDRFSTFHWEIQQLKCVIILFPNSHMADFHLRRQQVTISYKSMLLYIIAV